MTNWANIEDQLPEYEWVLVSAEDNNYDWNRFSIARYIPTKGFGWQFFHSESVSVEKGVICPANGDQSGSLRVDEIKYWAYVDSPEEDE